MRAALFLVLGWFPVLGGAAAQEASASIKETRCWVGDVAFSAGAGINAGEAVAVCAAGSGWTAAEAGTPVTGCLLEGKLSSVGAVVGIRNNSNLLIQCDASGRWTTLAAPAGG